MKRSSRTIRDASAAWPIAVEAAATATEMPAQGLRFQVQAETTPAAVLLGGVYGGGAGMVAVEAAPRVSA